MDEPCLFRPKGAQRFGHRPDQGCRKRAGELAFDACGVREGAKDVEDGAGAKLHPDWRHMAGRGVVHRGHHEANAGLIQAALDHLGADHDVETHFGQRIRSTRFGTEVAVAVFGDWHACACDDEGGGGGDVERTLAVTAGANDVHGPRRRLDRIAFGAHHACGGGVFIDRFAAHAQRHQEPAHLGRGGCAFKERGEGGLGLSPSQGAGGSDADQGFEDVAHAGTRACAASRKFFNS